MTSGAVERNGRTRQGDLLLDLFGHEENFARWIEHPTSVITHHDSPCCDVARMWFLSYARSMEIGNLSQYGIQAPTWLSQLYTWGPSEWPIAWCQLVRERVLDCGVFAALAREVFGAQGHQAHPAQALLSYNETCTRHWKDLWKKGPGRARKSGAKPPRRRGELFPWIGTELVYHEICVLELPDGSAKVYDSTWGSWYEPRRRKGFGSLLAVRTECPRLLGWGDRTLSCGEWTIL